MEGRDGIVSVREWISRQTQFPRWIMRVTRTLKVLRGPIASETPWLWLSRWLKGPQGFVRSEVFIYGTDRPVFCLSTRWTSAPACCQWHSNEAHHTSRKVIPKDLELDAALTQMSVMGFLCR
jgi:hypothetical protein